MKFRLFALLGFVGFCQSMNAQNNFSLYNLKGTPQAFYTNPSSMPKSKFFLSLPPLGMMNISATNSGFSFNDLFTKRADDSLVINTQNVIDGLSKLNFISLESNFELFGIGMKLKDTYFNFSVNSKTQMNIIYPKDLIQFSLEGNGKKFLGQRASLDGLGVNATSYVEYGFGATKHINDKLTVGGRVKLLSGIVNLRTKKTQLGIYTDSTDFAITIDGSAEVNTSNITQFYDSTSNFSGKDMIPFATNFTNKGLGLDLGATYIIDEKFSVNASLIDLGSIKWKSNVTTYKSNDVKFTYDGVDLDKYFTANGDSSKNIGRDLADTLAKVFDYQTNTDSYVTALTTKLYLGGNYQITKSLNAGVLLMSQVVKGNFKPGLSLSMNASLKSWLSATINYSIYNRTYSNIGLGLSLRGGPMQFYIMSDNILAFINPLNARSVHLCGGMSVFIKEKDKKGKDKKDDKVKGETPPSPNPPK